MEWICLWELTGLEKAALVAVGIAILVFLYVALSMVRHKELWEGRLSEIKYKEWSLGLPAPIAVIALAIAFAVAGVWWLSGHFPSNTFPSAKRNGRSRKSGNGCRATPESKSSCKEMQGNSGLIRTALSPVHAWPTSCPRFEFHRAMASDHTLPTYLGP